MDTPQRKSKYASLTVKEAISRLLATAETIELRKTLKPHEKKRANDAFCLSRQPTQPVQSKADERRKNYQQVIKKVYADCGPGSVVVCAVLGQTLIGSMVEYHRLRLPLEMKKHKNSFNSKILLDLAQAAQEYVPASPRAASPISDSPSLPPSQEPHPEQPLLHSDAPESSSNVESNTVLEPQRSLSGRVFALTHEDARAVVMSNQISGGVWMTDPYDNASLSFITIPISDEIALSFSVQRRQVM
ncbi:hypothetical protein BDW59DRAFT_167902 [Aspergillus cavernicola]|uniref:MADS-box domain-containing protein n=1 Tax=Aspergillus cavernicola TaxID=176166 RepID=A0ABR4H992_9EURO